MSGELIYGPLLKNLSGALKDLIDFDAIEIRPEGVDWAVTERSLVARVETIEMQLEQAAEEEDKAVSGSGPG